jgi:UDP-N-acetylmuramate--alanine ligase
MSLSETIHFIGIGGAGMSGMARVLSRKGVRVTGSDLRESSTLESLRTEYGIDAVAGHDPRNLGNATLVVASAAVKKDNPEMIAAHERGIPIVSRAEMLGRIMAEYPRSIAISGTHGKTTTTGMIATVLEAAGLDPTVLIGGDLPAFHGNARLGSTDVFVAEACEAYDSFLDLNPWLTVITNIEADHLDYYGDFQNILRSFRKFMRQTSGKAIVCGHDKGIDALLKEPEGFPTLVLYGSREGVAMRASDFVLDGMHPSYTASYGGQELGRVTLSVPGLHNVANSMSAVAVGMELGVPFEKIAEGLARFTGTGRRFEHLGETSDGVLVIDDYAHHPTELRATLAAARAAYRDRRIIAAFQPHLPSRTSDFMEEFAESFVDADHVFLTDIYLAREQPREGVTGASLAALTADRRGADRVTYVADKLALPGRLAEFAQPGDIVLTLGAGHDIREVAEAFLRGERAVAKVG